MKYLSTFVFVMAALFMGMKADGVEFLLKKKPQTILHVDVPNTFREVKKLKKMGGKMIMEYVPMTQDPSNWMEKIQIKTGIDGANFTMLMLDMHQVYQEKGGCSMHTSFDEEMETFTGFLGGLYPQKEGGEELVFVKGIHIPITKKNMTVTYSKRFKEDASKEDIDEAREFFDELFRVSK